MSNGIQILKFIISGDDSELGKAVERARKSVTGLFESHVAASKRLVDASVYVNGWRETLLEANGVEQRVSATALFEAQHQGARQLAADAGRLEIWKEMVKNAEEADRKYASNKEFIKSLQERSAQIGKTTADILEMQAAERGISADASPLIAKLREGEKFASDNAFLKSLQDRSTQIGKTTADLLEMQAAERGLSAQASPLIAKLREENKLASDTAFIKSLQDRSAQIGKTTVDLLEMQAAERGLSAQAAPMIARLRQAEQSFGATGISAAQTAAALRMVPAQFTDIVVSLQAGQAPLTVLLQQGGQLKDMFGGIGAAAKGMGSYVLGLINPYTVAAGVVGVLALAYYKGSQEAYRMREAIVMSGNASGVTLGQMRAYATTIDGVVGTHAKAVEAITEMVNAGVRGGDQLRDYAQVAIQWERTTGQAVGKTAEKFAELQKEPLKATLKLNEGTNYLTSSVYLQIKSLEEQGRTTEAANVAQKAFADALAERSGEMVKHLGLVERAWLKIKDVIAKTWDAIKAIGREATPDEAIPLLQKQINDLEERRALQRGWLSMPDERVLKSLKSQLMARQEEKNTEEARAVVERERAESTKATVKWSERLDRLASDAVKKKRDLIQLDNEYQAKRRAVGDDPAALERVDQEFRQMKAAIEEQYRDKSAASAAKKEETAYERMISNIRTKTGELQKELEQERRLTDSQKFREQLENDVRLKFTAGHRKKIDAALAELEAQEKLNDAYKGRKLTDQLLSENAPLATDFAQQWKQLGAAYDGTAAGLERLTQAQAVLLAKQPFAQQAMAIAQARAEAEQYLATMQRAQAREVQLVGMGGRQREYFNGLNQIEDGYAGRRYDLSRERERERANNGGALPALRKDYYEQQLADIEKFERRAKASYQSSFEAIGQAQANWLNGATRAFDDYAASAANVAEQTASIFGRVYGGMEDAAVSFAMTGKASSKNWAEAVIADLIRVQIRAQMVSVLGSAKGGGLLGSLFSWGINMLGGGQAAGVQSSGAVTEAVHGWGNVSAVDLGPVAGGRERGGPVAAGNLYEVNERGVPELLSVDGRQYLMMAGTSGHVTPLQDTPQPGASAGALNALLARLRGGTSAAPVPAVTNVYNIATTANSYPGSLGLPIAGQRANGGPVAAGNLYEVNERGVPELLSVDGRQYLMMAGTSGHVTPLQDTPQPGASAGVLDALLARVRGGAGATPVPAVTNVYNIATTVGGENDSAGQTAASPQFLAMAGASGPVAPPQTVAGMSPASTHLQVEIINKFSQASVQSMGITRDASGQEVLRLVVDQAVNTVADQAANRHGPMHQALLQRERG